jgi:hypothetical protein
MSENITVKVSGAIMRKLRTAGADARAHVLDGIRQATTQLYEDTLRNTPAATGQLRKSLIRTIDEAKLQGHIYPSLEYGEKLHGDIDSAGNLKSARSAPFVIPAREAQPGGTLYRWAQKRGVNPWAVRASIKKKGIKHNPFMAMTAKQDEAKVRKIFVGVLQRIADGLGD